MIGEAEGAGAEGFAGVFLHFLHRASVDFGVVFVESDEEFAASEDLALVADGDFVHFGDGVEEVVEALGEFSGFCFGVISTDGEEFSLAEFEEIGSGFELGGGDAEGGGDGASADRDRV